MASYTRQSTFADGDTITAALFNDEFNQLVNVFNASTGHKHDGTAGEGPVIDQIGDSGNTPINRVLVDTTNNYIEFWIDVSSTSTQQLYIADGAIVPTTDNDIDLGTSSLEFKNLYLDGTAKIDTLTVDEAATIGTTLGVTGATTLSSTLAVTGAATLSSTLAVTGNTTVGGTLGVTGATTLSSTLAVTGTSTLTGNVTTTNDLSVGGNLTVTGNATISGNLTFGDADTDSINIAADITSNLVPNVDDTYDIGTTAKRWKDAYIDGTAYIDAIIFNGTSITSTASELNLLDGATVTTTEINILDGDTAATATTLADADRVIVNDNGIMKHVALTDFEVYFENVLDTLASVTTVGALGAGSITSGFGDIDNGGSAITTTGTITYGSLSDGTITITAFADEDDMVSNSATLVPTQQSVKAYVDAQVTAQDLDLTSDSGTIAIDLDSETLTVAGGTGIDTSATANTVTVAIDSTVATLTGTQTLTNKTLTSPVINTGVSGTAVLDDDTFATASATTLATSESIKAYVDANVQGADTLEELSDTNITTPADAAMLFYDTTTSKWIDNVVSGDITIADTGVAAIGSGVIVNADINASAAISVSKTALVDGTGLTLTGDTLAVDASLTHVTALGTIATGTWQGTAIADAYVANDLTISGGTIDSSTTINDSVIGGTTPAAGTFTTLTANTSITGTLATAAQGNVTSLGTLTGLTVSGDAAFDTNTLFVDVSANSVGLGTTTPSAQLHIVGTDTTNQVIIENTDAAADTAPDLILFRNSGSPAVNDNIGNIQFDGENSASTQTTYGAIRSVILDATATNEQGRLDFYTNQSGTLTAGLSIDASGNVGIGTTSPASGVGSPLTLTSSSTGFVGLRLNGTGSYANDWDLYASGDGAGLDYFGIFDRTNTVYRMVATNTGNVGIGTTSPTAKLELNGGDAYFYNTATLGGIRIGYDGSNYWDIQRENASTGRLLFSHGGSERVSIEPGGNVGIGTNNPTNLLDVENSGGNAAIDVISGTSSLARLNLGDTAGTNRGGLVYDNSDDSLTVRTNGSDKVTIDSPGNFRVGLSNSAPANNTEAGFLAGSATGVGSCFIQVPNNAANGYGILGFYAGSTLLGNITKTGSNTCAYNTSSDYRLKENVDYDFNALDRVAQLKPARFNFIADADKTVDGFLAHEVSDIVPEAITGVKDEVDEDGNAVYQGIDQSKLVPLLTKAIQEQQVLIEQLQAEVALLKGE